MKTNIFTLLIAILANTALAQNLQLGWGYTNGSTGADGTNDLVLDAAGNTYVTGYFSGTVDFDKGPGTANLSVAAGQTTKDAFVLKLDPQGNYVWAIRIGGFDNYDQVGTKIALDTAGNVVVTGTFFGNVLLPPNNTNYNSSATKPGSFMVKIDAAGTSLWARAWCNTTSEMIIEDFTIDSNNRIVAVGEFTSTVNFSTNATPNSKTSNGGKDFFVMQVGQNGNLQNVQSGGNSGNDYARYVVAVLNNYWIGGSFLGTIDFDFSAGTSNLTSNNSTFDIFTLILTSNFSYVSAFTIGGNTSFDVPKGIMEWNGLYVYQVGLFEGANVDLDPSPTQTAIFSSSSQRPFVQKFDVAGNLIWAVAFNQHSVSQSWGIQKISIKTTGELILLAQFANTIDVNPAPALTSLVTSPTNGNAYYCLIELDLNGIFIKADLLEEQVGDWELTSLESTINGIWQTGSFINTIDINPSPSTTTATSAGLDDMLLLNLISCSDTIVNTTETACGSYNLSNGQAITQSGTYNDTLQTILGCDSVVARSITISPLPNTALVWQGSTLQLANSITTNTHHWLDCATGQPIPGATGTSYTPTANGSFAVVVSNGTCTDTSVCETLTNFSVPEAANIPVTIYPNPTTGILHLESPQPWERVEVVNMLGKIVLNTKKEEIDLTHLPVGMYLVKVHFEGGVVVERVVKEN